MSDDIVARLRADSQWFAKVPKHNKVQIDAEKVQAFAEKLKTAADEIERLRRDYSAAEQDHVDGVVAYVHLDNELNLLRARIRRLVAE